MALEDTISELVQLWDPVDSDFEDASFVVFAFLTRDLTTRGHHTSSDENLPESITVGLEVNWRRGVVDTLLDLVESILEVTLRFQNEANHLLREDFWLEPRRERCRDQDAKCKRFNKNNKGIKREE